MENQLNVEQPETNTNSSLNNESVNQSKTECEKLSSGSTLGKFKDATSLLSAYNALEVEFTRKSQRLSETEKRLAELEKNISSAQEDCKGSGATSSADLTENELNNQDNDFSLNKVDDKEQKSIVWKTKVDDFFSKREDAKSYSLEMAKILKKYPHLRDHDSALDISYSLAKAKTLKEPADLINDSNFIDNFIMNNDNLKNKIIHEYIRSVKSSNNIPSLMKNDANGILASSKEEKPKSIFDAGKIVSKMFGVN